MGFELVEGFSRPRWKSIHGFIKAHILKDELSETWKFVARKWLLQLSQDLGGGCRVFESQHFYCLSDLGVDVTDTLIAYAEWVLTTIREILREAAWSNFHGKHVLLLFLDADDYYSYISYFYRQGDYPQSGGGFLRSGYAHVAVPFIDMHSAHVVLAHELTHNLLCHLTIPIWLNEGLAVVIEGVARRSPFRLDQELVDEHLEHWNENNIQAFWAGKSFHIPGQDNKLSYSLAAVFVKLLFEKGPDFKFFVLNANYRDAGQKAALEILDSDLGEVAATFLGPGNWRPNLKTISAYFAQGQKAKE